MINKHEAILTAVVTHKLGNKSKNEDIKYAPSCHENIDEELHDILLHYFTDHYKEPEFYEFTYNSGDLSLNPLYNYLSNVFDDPELLYEESIRMARLLHDKSSHPHIKEGELYIAYIRDLLIDDEMVDGIAIVKAENKENFLNIGSGMKIENSKGTPITKIDKACLVLNTERDTGYKILNIDHSNRNVEARYWRDDYLYITPRTNQYSDTTDFIKLTANFIKKKIKKDDTLTKLDEVNFLTKTFEFVKNNDSISMEDYKENVLKSPANIEEFESFQDEFSQGRSRSMSEDFVVSEMALKKYAKVLKSIIKLDKNFHIYVHGDHSKIMKGVDGEGKKYYMIYYDEET